MAGEELASWRQQVTQTGLGNVSQGFPAMLGVESQDNAIQKVREDP